MDVKHTDCQLISDFTEGDLLYGLEEEARQIYRSRLVEKIERFREQHNRERIGKKIYITIDDIHNDAMQDVFFGESYDIAISPLNTPSRLHFRQLLTVVDNQFHPSRASVEELLFDSPCSKKLAASCKQALVSPTSKIRFCLDGLILDQVRNPQLRFFRNFTSMELRFIAINWDNANLNLSDRVFFYEHGQRVAPPWSESTSVTAWLTGFAPPPFSPTQENAGDIVGQRQGDDQDERAAMHRNAQRQSRAIKKLTY